MTYFRLNCFNQSFSSLCYRDIDPMAMIKQNNVWLTNT